MLASCSQSQEAELKLQVAKSSLVLQFEMQTRLHWSKSVHMETIQINVLVIFPIFTANYSHKNKPYLLESGFLQLIIDVKSVFQTILLQTLNC